MAMKFKDTGDGYKQLVVREKGGVDATLSVETLIGGEPGLVLYFPGKSGGVQLTRKQSINLALAIVREMAITD